METLRGDRVTAREEGDTLTVASEGGSARVVSGDIEACKSFVVKVKASVHLEWLQQTACLLLGNTWPLPFVVVHCVLIDRFSFAPVISRICLYLVVYCAGVVYLAVVPGPWSPHLLLAGGGRRSMVSSPPLLSILYFATTEVASAHPFLTPCASRATLRSSSRLLR